MAKINSPDILQYIDILLKHGNYTKAAQNLYISQSYLTQVIKSIEHELGIEIINRQTSPLQLTEAGKIYYQYLVTLEDKKEQFYKRIALYSHPHEKIIRLGILPSLATYLLPLFLPSFMQKYPNIKIELNESLPLDNEEKTENQTLDFFIGQNPETISPNLINYHCGKHCYFMLIPNTSTLYQNNTLWVEFNNDLLKTALKEKLILTSHGSAIRKQIDYLIHKYKIQPNIVLESRNIFTLVSLAQKGLGITFIPESIQICQDTKMNNYNLCPLPLDLISISYFIAHSVEKTLNKQEKDLINIFLTAFD